MREAKLKRETLETNIMMELSLDGDGTISIDTELGFLNHMLKAMAFYAGFNLELKCIGDLEVDSHHTVEDIGIVLGSLFKEAIGDRKGIQRFSSTITPMDESLAMVVIDISNRPYLVENLKFDNPTIGNMATDDFKEFFRAFAYNAGITLHIDILRGENDHHKIEAIFKGLGRALKEAIIITNDEVVSTKGVL